MSYATNLTAAQQESTPEFYRIQIGTTVYRYTTYRSPLTFLSNTYTPATIKRGDISYDTDFKSTELTVTAALSDPFSIYIANQPSEPARIKIYRALQSDTSDYVILFNGTVKNVSIENHQVNATCTSRNRYLEKKIPRIIYQSFCNHDVFDNDCGLNGNLWKVAGTVNTVSGSTIQADEWKAYADDYFTGGMVETSDGDARLITDHVQSTGVLTLQIPFDSRVAAGVSVDAYPGCDGNPATCVNKFNNLTAFLGMSYIPSKNPVLWGFK
jgi:uncharacterized phage protein (TIGR02218 family)